MTHDDDRQAALEILGRAIGEIIPEHRASGTASEHATATAKALLASVEDLRKKHKAALLAYVEMWKLASRLVIHGEQAAWVHTGQPAEVWEALRELGIDPRDDATKRGE